MKFAHFFIDHPRFATVISIFITLFGLAASTFLPVAQYPAIVPPTVQITTSYPGASADTVARTVATPLEQAINGVENMDYITSQSTGNGLLTITVIFKIGTDPNTDLMLTQSRVQDTLSRLPEDVQLQGVQVKKTIQALLLGVHVYSPDGSGVRNTCPTTCSVSGTRSRDFQASQIFGPWASGNTRCGSGSIRIRLPHTTSAQTRS